MPLSFLQRRQILKGRNALELVPIRNYKFETGLDSMITIIIPKFHKKFAVKFISPMLKSPDIKLDLDKYGSFVWMQMDGNTKVGLIVERMIEHFGDELKDAVERVSKFVTILYEQRLITFQELQNKGE